MYKVRFAKSAEKELYKIERRQLKLIFRKIEKLSINPYPPGAIKLKSSIDLWRIRSGKYRIIYSTIESELIVEIIRVRHRKDIYR